jgi:hypothetical protein
MLQFPSSWPSWSVWAGFGTLLAGLDLTMSYIATMVVKTRGTDAMAGWFAAGTIIALMLFWAFASSLVYGDMLEMNVLWIGTLLALVPVVNAAQTGELPGLRVTVGLIGMIVFVMVIQWPGGEEGDRPPNRSLGARPTAAALADSSVAGLGGDPVPSGRPAG